MQKIIRTSLLGLLVLTFVPMDIIPNAFADDNGKEMSERGERKRGGKRHHRRKRWMKELNLTEEQQDKIKEVRKAHRPKMVAAREKKRDARKALTEAVKSGASNSDLKSKNEALIDANADYSRTRFGQMLAIRELLTPEQRAKFKGMRGEWKEGRKGRRGEKRRGKRRGNDDGEGEDE